MTTAQKLDDARSAFSKGLITKDELIQISDDRRDTQHSARACPLSPLEDRIVARELPLPEIPADTLWLPEQTGGGPIRAEVIAVGPGRRCDSGELLPPPAQVGDRVVLTEFGPTEIDVDGETLLCCPPMMVLAVER